MSNKEYQKMWKLKNKDKVKEYNKKWYLKNKDKKTKRISNCM